MGILDRFRKQQLPEAQLNNPTAQERALPYAVAEQVMRPKQQIVIGEKEIAEATAILQKYKSGKENFDSRIVENEKWWGLRHWEVIRNKRQDSSSPEPQPASAWLFNAILNKHADAMDNYPEPIVLPREQSDEESAKILSSILPVVMEYNDFEEVYDKNWWEKLKHGAAAYGVFWDPKKENGLGDVSIRQIDLLKIFWEPGVTDIQKSRNLFILELVPTDVLEAQYPQHKGKLQGNTINVKEYLYTDTVDNTDKSIVVDWYYKKQHPDGRQVLHFVKFVGSALLYASDNDPIYADNGFYNHGRYPVEIDVLFPEKGTPAGMGYIALCKDPQLYIDKLSANILENSLMATKKRYFMSSTTNVNKEQFLDWNEPIVTVEGELDDTRIKEIPVRSLDGIHLSVLQMKIEEMKDTSANRDVNSGGAASGITAASAIAALQEAGNKSSRDMIAASYRTYTSICELIIELIRQFYDESRSFRVTGIMPGQYEFVNIDNSAIGLQSLGFDSQGREMFRKPIFDLKIKAQKKNPFSRMEQNERAKELYAMGFFNPERAQEAQGALEMMDFEGIDKVREQVNQGQTLLNICQQQSQQLAQLGALLASVTGQPIVSPNMPALSVTSGGAMPQPAPEGQGKSFASGIMEAHTPMTDYGQRLAKRSSPDMNVGG